MIKMLFFYATLPVIFLISKLPDSLFYGLSNLVAFLLRDVIHYRTRIVTENLQRSFPDKTQDQIRETRTKFYRNLSDTLLESLKMGSLSKTDIARRFQIRGLDSVKAYHDQGRTVVLVTSHYANWEWAGLAISAAYKEKPVIIIYQPMSNPYYETYINGMRAKFGSVMVAANNVLRRIASQKSEPSIIILVADQSPTSANKNHSMQFLNQETVINSGPEKISRMADAVVMFGEINRLDRGYYEANLVPLVEEPAKAPVNQITEAHVHHLEGLIQKNPADWLWSHRRWKLKRQA